MIVIFYYNMKYNEFIYVIIIGLNNFELSFDKIIELIEKLNQLNQV